MKKLFLIGFLLVSISSFAQSVSKNKNLFIENDTLSAFSFLKEKPLMNQFYKYYNSPAAFSIYNPKPGFNPISIKSQKYYSFANTSSLLRREMSNIKPEPIFPEPTDKKTFGEAVFEGVLDGIFKKK
ncbi:hypothetical protein K6T82_00355 [Flavobacterium sp. 17A]|uniref:GLPGLI family protein n=1 Tax=Flavobacterium potami TaxID=2872310 RepID=A0A9X1H5S1_9FLAO|nr:hypothetical protein [Flavobacterium potami]MBZ4033200.1 hypothetical protein [Flavobacterium potami]